MSQLQIAERYAKSLIDLAQEQKLLSGVYEDILSIREVVKHPEFASMLQSPVILSDKKLAIFKQLFENKTQAVTLHFIQLLIQKGREGLLPQISQAFINQYKAIKKIKTARIISAGPLSESELQNIKQKFSGWLKPGEQMELSQKTDASLIGGFIMEMDDRNYDASVKRQLDEMKENLYDKSYISLIEKR